MTKNSLLLMVLLVAIVGFGTWYLGQDEERPTPPVNPLSRVDFSSIKKLSCQLGSDEGWSIENFGTNRLLTAPDVANGQAVAVNEDLYNRIIGFLIDARPTSTRKADKVDLAEWGLKPAAISLSIQDAGGTHAFEIGRPDLNEDVMIRQKGSDDLFVIPARVVADLSRESKWFRDPRLCDIPGHLAERFDFKRGSGEEFSLIRASTQWYLEFPDGRRIRARASIADQVTTAMAGVRGAPLEEDDKRPEVEKPALAVTIHGLGKKVSLDLVTLSPESCLGRRGDEPDLRAIDPSLVRYLDVRADRLEDPSLVGIDANDLSSVAILHPEGRPLRLEKKNRFWILRFSKTLSWTVDSALMKRFQTDLLAMNWSERIPMPNKPDADYTLEVGFAPELELPAVQVSFSKPDGEGNRIAWRSDETGAYRVGPDVMAVLKTRYWNVMARYVCQASSGRIDNISIKDPQGVRWLMKRAPQRGSWILFDKKKNGETVSGFQKIVFPEDAMTSLLNFLSQMNVLDVLGEQSPADIERNFANCRYEIRWTYPEPMPNEGVDAWAPRRTSNKFLVIGGRIDDTSLMARVSDFPALACKMAAESLLAVDGVLKHLK